MTRMVDEQRGYIGTLKALGYSKGRITFKYLMYAVAASVGGSALGFSIGFKLFPTVIFSAYSIMYILPPIKTPFNLKYAVLSTAIASVTTTFAAWFACCSELADTPASLMRPKAPKAGKRILLERIGFLWKRLSFTKKITARNLFRYKKRLYMTVFGIAGCTALLLTGFGLKDSIISIVSKQFDELYQYQAIVELKHGITADESSSITDQLKGDDRIDGYMLMLHQNVELVEGDTTKSAILSVPEGTEKLKDYIVFRNRKTKEAVPLTDNGAVLTEKLANQLGVKAGDTVYIKDGDTGRLEVKVNGIIENYVQHYIYLSPSTYTRIYNREPEFTKLVVKTSDTSEKFEKQLSEDIMANDMVQNISLTTGLTESFEETISSLNYVVLVLIVSAAALAFVVMYNLTNINITERMREIASLKVLGFYDKEVSEYVFRENIFLTIIGTAFGLVFGIFLHRFTITTAEVNYVMFGRTIKPLSYVYSGVLTMVFSGFVSVVMHFRLKTIGMVESMKSVD
jgi:putative ABC transport system permease protein